jgi:ribA/ribD-fused uncharacterized protein
MAIKEFRGKYWCLSNFAPVMGIITVEHWYQANKTFELVWQRKILTAPSPEDAKHLARDMEKSGNKREDWHQVNVPIMSQLVALKMLLRSDYRKILLDTGTEELVEGNWWHDNFWGDCTCERCSHIVGLNNLGKIHMALRSFFGQYSVFPVIFI